MGVKSLWSLLAPAGRPVLLETMEGKSMAIDSSIWIYQFQATMRDKEGRGLVNAHVLGFLRRICKLLFYGIKPVFVFDGGAPALKRMTISERKKKKSGAADSHVKIAEKLLAAQMRKEALNHAQSVSKGVGKPPEGVITIDEDTVYLEDLDGRNPPSTPAKNKGKAKEVSSTEKKSKWRDHDPYRLPDIDMDAAVAKATRSTAPDPRLATEDELRAFIEMMRPEDIDVNTPAFRELPTEVQYEIIGDLRLKSRQTSHKRLMAMLKSAPTALDFSRAQIMNLKQRNALTQQLLETTDSIGKANVSIPIRIASERNKEYVLVKNEDEIGGWVLGIRDTGTADKPIVLDNAGDHIKSDEGSDDEMDMEEVAIPQTVTPDPDLQEYRRELTLGAVERRQATAAAKGRPTAEVATKKRTPKKNPLFIPDGDDSDVEVSYETDEDAEMITAMQASLEDQEADDLQRALEESRKAKAKNVSVHSPLNEIGPSRGQNVRVEDSDDDLYVEYTPSRLDAALRFANTSRDTQTSTPSLFSRPSLLHSTSSMQNSVIPVEEDEDEDEDMEEVVVPVQPAISSAPRALPQMKELASNPQLLLNMPEESEFALLRTPPRTREEIIAFNLPPAARQGIHPSSKPETKLPEPRMTANTTSIIYHNNTMETTAVKSSTVFPTKTTSGLNDLDQNATRSSTPRGPSEAEAMPVAEDSRDSVRPSTPHENEPGSDPERDIPVSASALHAEIANSSAESSSEDEGWSRPPSPGGSTEEQQGANKHGEDWDAAEEMNVHEETGEFVRFAAQVRGRDVDTVRQEIDNEIRELQQQRKAAMRDSEDVNQAMITQIMTMLRFFGIPYITAPMEAEAQCATLVDLGLVDGVITDDSDVFLFGAKRVFKNMFNQSKTVECFLLTDLARELGLDRGTLVRLAYLLGSDYTAGLPGVGPVVAMELLQGFPGDDALHKFKDWWMKVQSGRDKQEDTNTTFKKRFKKRFKDLYLPSDWPNPAVRDAYYHPVVDSSEEPFKWGLPDLDGLRGFFREELSWNADKVDELLLPIIQKMNKRGQDAAMNRQGTLNDFFSVSEGGGLAEPRRREAYASRRLQALVSAHRKAQKQIAQGTQLDESEEEEPLPVKKRRKKVSPTESGTTDSGKGKGKGRGTTRSRRGRGTKMQGEGCGDGSTTPPESKSKRTGKGKSKPKRRSTADPGSDAGDEFVPGSVPDAAPVREMELRKRVRPRPAYKGLSHRTNEKDAELEAVESGSEGSEYRE